MSAQGDGSGRSLLLLGGHIYAPRDPFATAMLTQGGTIAWIGDDDAAHAYADEVDEVVHLDGALVAPAFVDAHVHLTALGLALSSLDLSGVTGADDLLARLRAGSAESSGVILGRGWDDSGWEEPRIPTRTEIDTVVRGRPAYLTRVDEHSALASSALLARVPGVESLDGFDPDGPLRRDAHHAVRAIALTSVGPDERRNAQRAALDLAARRGIACVHEMAGPSLSSEDDLRDALSLGAEPGMPEVIGYWGELEAIERARDLGAHGAAGDLCVDGSLGSHTACLRAAYEDRPGTVGADYLDVEQVARHVVASTRAGLQAGFHVIGDRAADIVVDGLLSAADTVGADAVRACRHRLEHVEMLDDRHIRVLADLAVVASVQPAFDAEWGGEHGMYAARLGRGRALTLNPFAAMSAAGVCLALGSDAPVTPLDPWGAVRAAAFHRNPHHRVSVRAAFAAHTRGGRRAAREEAAQPGVLSAGAPATYAVWQVDDLAVQAPDERIAAWSTDPRSGTPGLPALEGARPDCARTVVSGVTIYDRGSLA